MTMTPLALEQKLHTIIGDYLKSHTADNLDEADLHCSMAFIIDSVDEGDDDTLTLEGGIDCHFDGELRDSLLAAL